MRPISRCFLMLIAMALAFCFSARLAYADGESVTGCSNCNGYSFTATITQVGTSSTYQVVYTITNNSGPASTPYNWSLTAFDNGNSATAPTGGYGLAVKGPVANGSGIYTSDYAIVGGKTNNGNGNCNGTISSAFCVQQSGTVGPVLHTGQSLTFAFDINCTSCGLMSSWDFLGSSNPLGSTTGNVYAITNWGTPTSMPEPSVAFLYASTLAVGLVFAWRSRALRRPIKT